MALGLRTQMGNYEPLLQLATGGMATVYVARQIGAGGFERLVVLKRVHPHLLSNRAFYDMFRDEARVAAMLHHSNVVAVTDVVEADGELVLVMEYVDSVALSTLSKAVNEQGQHLPPAAVVRILVDTLSGLHAAHEARDMRGRPLEIVHRDVSPQNLIVGVDGTSRLIDFGVAKARHRLTETKSGSIKGKYAYMAPEQVRAKPMDRRADLFSAGIVLWEALCGGRLFRADTELDTMRRIAEAPIPPPSSLIANLPPGLEAVVMKALTRDVDRRFQTASEFIEALEAVTFPAPPREVAAMVKAYCGDRIDARRQTLEDMLAGRAEPLSAARLPIGRSEPATIATSPSARPKVEPPDPGTEGQIAATHDAPAPVRRSTWSLVIGVGVVVLGGALAGVLWSARHSTAPPIVAVSLAPSPSDVGADEVELEILSDSPIERVSAPGIHGVHVDGSHARLLVARWGGELDIDATLEGGVVARAVAQSDGPRLLQLVAITADAAGSSSTTIGAPSGGPPPAGTGAPKPSHPPWSRTPVARPPAELHANPYGQ